MEHRKTAADSIILMICTLASRLLGILKARAIATVFGATGIADVINFTFNIPNNFRKLFAEGALSSAYVPVFTTEIEKEKGGIVSSSALLARMQGFQLLISVPLIVLTWISRVQIIGFLSDFSDPSHLRLSGELLVYFMVFLGTISFSALYGGVLQSHRSFFLAAASPLLFSISVIASVYLLSSRFGAYSMAIGVIVGGTLQASATFIGLRRLGYRFRFSFDFTDGPFRRVMIAWGPVTITAVLAIVTQQVSFYFASTLSEGVVTAFSNAIIIWQAPYGIFYTAIATVFFPAMVGAYHQRDREQLGFFVSQGLVYIATFLVPAAIALYILRNETTAILLQSGRFTLSDTLLTGTMLKWFAIGMPFVAGYGFLQRACYSTGKFSLTVAVGAVLAITDILVTIIGLKSGMGGQSLSLANTVAHLGGITMLALILYRGNVMRIRLRSTILSLARLAAANIPLGLLAFAYVRFADRQWWQDGSTWTNALVLAGLYLIAIGITIASYKVANIEFLSVLRKKGSASK